MTPEDIMGMKGKQKIAMLTACSYPIARVLENAKVDMILVGDSGVMVELGKDSTKEATLDEMKIFTAAVKRGAGKTLIVSDMPIGTYDDIENAKKSANELISSGADSVKLEGNKSEIVKALVDD